MLEAHPFLFALLLCGLLAVPATARDARLGAPARRRYRLGARAATDAGLEILREGGNAFDAGGRGPAALSVVEPVSSGPGRRRLLPLHDAKRAATCSSTRARSRRSPPRRALSRRERRT